MSEPGLPEELKWFSWDKVPAIVLLLLMCVFAWRGAGYENNLWQQRLLCGNDCSKILGPDNSDLLKSNLMFHAQMAVFLCFAMLALL
jgi:hypothetical protein